MSEWNEAIQQMLAKQEITMADEVTATANEIEREMMAWRGASGGVHAIRACAIAVARKMDARFSAALATPPASPSPAPAAVEELVARLREVRYLNLTSIDPSTKSQLDTVGKLMGEAATALSTLAADKARVEAERDEARQVIQEDGETIAQQVTRAEAAEARASALEGALGRGREAILSEVNGQSIQCTVWMPGGGAAPTETVVDFIDAALSPAPREDQ